MQEEWYEPSPRDIRRAKAFASTASGQQIAKRAFEANHRCLEWRIQNEGFTPSPEAMAEHEKWRAGHPELYTNPHK
mgnify:CR=1 FL=1